MFVVNCKPPLHVNNISSMLEINLRETCFSHVFGFAHWLKVSVFPDAVVSYTACPGMEKDKKQTVGRNND